MNERRIAGPAAVAATGPVRTKIPVPMMAPMPSVTRLIGPSARRRPPASPCASARIFETSFLEKRANRKILPRELVSAARCCGPLRERELDGAVAAAVAEVNYQPDGQPEEERNFRRRAP